MSFWKQLPPNPTLARKKCGPMRRSTPQASATSYTLAPVASQIAEMALIEEIRCAKSAFAACAVSRCTYQLGQLAAPQPRAQHTLLGHPPLVHLAEQLGSAVALCGVEAADQHTVGVEQVLHRRALRQELGVRQDLEGRAGLAVRLENRAHRRRGAARHRRLLHNDFGRLRDGRNAPRGRLDVAQVRREAAADARRLGRRVDAHEHNLRLVDGLVNVRRKEEVAPTALAHNRREARLKHGQLRQVLRVPRGNPLRVHVDDRHDNVGALLRQHRAGRTAHIAGTDAANVRDLLRKKRKILLVERGHVG